MNEPVVSTLPLDLVECRHAIWRMFRDAADEDYLIARFSARANLIYEFWWNAQQATEKYLKAILLLNGHETRRYGHSLTEMFILASEIAGDLIPVLSCPPREFSNRDPFSKNSRGFKPSIDFIREIEIKGDPNNRYRMFSSDVRRHCLVHFDEISFLLRRVAFPLDLQIEDHKETAREHLSKNRNLQLHRTMAFERGLSEKNDRIWAEHFRWCNFAYFNKEAIAADEIARWGGMINAAPYMALESSSPNELASIEWIAKAAFPIKIQNEVVERVRSIRGTNR